jgi:hypothetical protein
MRKVCCGCNKELIGGVWATAEIYRDKECDEPETHGYCPACSSTARREIWWRKKLTGGNNGR